VTDRHMTSPHFPTSHNEYSKLPPRFAREGKIYLNSIGAMKIRRIIILPKICFVEFTIRQIHEASNFRFVELMIHHNACLTLLT